jgi:hypothetical protein
MYRPTTNWWCGILMVGIAVGVAISQCMHSLVVDIHYNLSQDAPYIDDTYKQPFPLPTHWSWYDYSSTTTLPLSSNLTHHQQNYTSKIQSKNNNKNDTRKLLIAHYSGMGDKYINMLEIAKDTSHAYGRKWGVDVLIMKGVAMGPTAKFAGANKIQILQEALHLLSSKSYHTLLMLDADAIIVDLDLDFLTLLPPEYMLAGQRVNPNDPLETWNINNGVTMWNLRHPRTKHIVNEWQEQWLKRIQINRDHEITDQLPLQEILRLMGNDERKKHHLVYSIQSPGKTFGASLGASGDEIAVRHFTRSKMYDWTGKANDARSIELMQARNETCTKFYPFCEEASKPNKVLQ